MPLILPSIIHHGCMHLSKEVIEEFKAIVWDEFGVELSDGEAEQRGLSFLELVNSVLIDSTNEE